MFPYYKIWLFVKQLFQITTKFSLTKDVNATGHFFLSNTVQIQNENDGNPEFSNGHLKKRVHGKLDASSRRMKAYLKLTHMSSDLFVFGRSKGWL